jgi:hypothetical protein
MSDKIFVNGMLAKLPHESAPDFVKLNISCKVDELTTFLQDHAKPDGWVNISVKESKGGKLYCELNQYSRPADDYQHRSHRDEAPNPIDEPDSQIPF